MRVGDGSTTSEESLRGGDEGASDGDQGSLVRRRKRWGEACVRVWKGQEWFIVNIPIRESFPFQKNDPAAVVVVVVVG